MAADAALAALALGGNVGDVVSAFHYALDRLERSGDTRIVAQSAVYRTRPWGRTDQPDFLNMAVTLETRLDPRRLLALCLAIEDERGRRRERRWGPRTLDLDLIAYGDQRIDEPGLQIPHPRAVARGFVMIPLAEIAPDLLIAGRTVRQWALECDQSGVIRDKEDTRRLGRS